jgi:hypothetical protein
VSGEMRMMATRDLKVGKVLPVDISLSNGTSESRLIVPSQVFAITPDGRRIIPIPPGQAIREAGSANALSAGLGGAAKDAAIGAVGGAIIGTALGAAVGAAAGSPGTGAAAGAAIGGGSGLAGGAIVGGAQGDMAAHDDAASQISDLSLRGGEVQPKFSVNGYVFFPDGDYKAVEMTVVNQETHDADVLRSDLR